MESPIAKYNFRDDQGHPLENCVEYITILAALDKAQGIATHWDMLVMTVKAGDSARDGQGVWEMHPGGTVDTIRSENAAQAKQIKRLREALTTIADSDMPVCNSCEGEGNRYADGKAHYYSEHAPTIPCPECYGVGRIPDLTANDMRELAEEALKEASHD